MPRLIRILHLEDDFADTEFVQSTLEAQAVTCEVVRVEDSEAFATGLVQEGIDLIISDFSLPSYDGRSALALAGRTCPDVPFVFFSGTMGEEVAIEALRGGATDYVLKDRPSRLAPIVIRALREAEEKRNRKRIEWDLHSAQERFKSIYDSSKDAIVYVSLEGQQQDVNQSMVNLTGYSKEDLLTMPYQQLTAKEYCLKEADAIHTVVLTGQPVEYEKEIIRRDGSRVPIVLSAFVVKAGDDMPIGLGMILKDVTERKRAEREIIELAYHDALTGLPNRRLYYDRLKLALCPAARTRKPVGVLVLDLDGFKTVNDTLGHAKGDLVLQAVADRLKASIRAGDTVARSGGDEFIILLPELSEPEDAERIAQKLLGAFGTSFLLDGQEFSITASMGLSIYPKDGVEADGLARNADAAMYRAKKQGGNTYELCNPAMNASVSDRLTLERHLRQALERREFRLYYQPVIDLNSGQITAMEALLRWQHPNAHRLLAPAEFIEVAEETGSIVPLSLWVLQTACRQAVAWHKRGYPYLRVAINLSDRQIWRRDFVAQVHRVLTETGMAPEMLEFEITERMALQNPDITISVLASLSSMGIDLSIDDFGTGHGSLNCLRQMPVKTLKMDQSFVGGIAKNTDDATIVKTLISLGHNLRLKVIAEGVETPEQLAFLQFHQCDAVQGFLFSPAVSSDNFERLLATQPFLF
ncbi:MAG: EAL domain-containing protein [Nitrospirota bacterium]|nr:EAL domain-containing protein [Nitrospirota bacterium]